jgi:hypothetical protein
VPLNDKWATAGAAQLAPLTKHALPAEALVQALDLFVEVSGVNLIAFGDRPEGRGRAWRAVGHAVCEISVLRCTFALPVATLIDRATLDPLTIDDLCAEASI